MGIDTLYASGIEDSIQRDLANPKPLPTESFSAWSFLKSGAKGVPSGLLESGGSIADLMSGAANALASTEASGSGMFGEQSDAERASSLKAAGNNGKLSQFDTTAGSVLRRKADTFAPDPSTSSTADQVIHGLTRGLTKAVTDIAIAGPAAGSVAFGLDEGNTAAQRLSEKGIDAATAAKVGAVTGVASAIGAALPIGGPNVLSTIGLAAAGGPATFMAQEALSRKILAEAGHKDEASLHDPLDPLGLALSTAIPGIFGAAHIRGINARAAESARLANAVKQIESGGNRYGKDGALLTSPKGAQGEMQVMPGTATDPGFGVAPAANNSPEELARVGRDYLGAMTQRYGGDTDKALAAYNAGPGAVDKALKFGDDWKSHLPKETQDYIVKGNKVLGDHGVQTAAADPAVVDAARVKVTNEALTRNLPDHPQAYAEVMRASDEVAAGRMPDVEPVPIRAFHGTKATEAEVADAAGLTRSADIGPHFTTDPDTARIFADNQGTPGRVLEADLHVRNPLELPDLAAWQPMGIAEHLDQSGVTGRKATDTEHGQLAGDVWKAQQDAAKDYWAKQPEDVQDLRNKFSGKTPEEKAKMDKVMDGLTDVSNDAGKRVIHQWLGERGHDSIKYKNEFEGRPVDTYIAFDGSRITRPGERPRQPVATRSEGTNSLPRPESVAIEEAKPTPPKPAAGKGDNELPSAESQKVAALAETNPDLRVKLPGSDETMSVTEALAQAKEAAAHEAQEVSLFQAALDCALSFGEA